MSIRRRFGCVAKRGAARSGEYFWEAGIYAAAGITRFFGESFSLGAVAEIQGRHGEGPDNGVNPQHQTTRVVFDVVRLVAAVYF